MTWDDLWAVARYDLGISEQEFWALTPRQFNLLVERHEEAQTAQFKRDALFFGSVICAQLNLWRGKHDPALKPVDIFPGILGEPKEPQTLEQQVAIFEMWKAAWPGAT